MDGNIQHQSRHDHLAEEIKPLLRGWFHAAATIAAIVVTIILLIQSAHDLPRFFSLLVFGLSMIVLYTTSSVYHIGKWRGRWRKLLRTLDHANIFVLIAGTYTPICVNVLPKPLGWIVLAVIWSMAAAGVGSTVLTFRLPRWVTVMLYLVMGWVALVTFPSLIQTLPIAATLILLAGGVLYSIGGVIYALKRPNPLPRFFGFHEIFHLFVIGGSAAFVFAIWTWVVPYQG